MAEQEALAVIVVAAGASSRMDGVDKVWVKVRGIPILAHSVKAMSEAATELIVVVKAQDEVPAIQLLESLRLRPSWRVVRGGSRRQDSVRSGLHAIRSAPRVAVHDAARPLATAALLKRVCEASVTTGAAIPGLQPVDTVKRVQEGYVVETVDRSALWSIQTPQAFATELITRVYAERQEDIAVTDDAQMIEQAGGRVMVVTGERWNFKITETGDIERVAALLAARNEAIK